MEGTIKDGIPQSIPTSNYCISLPTQLRTVPTNDLRVGLDGLEDTAPNNDSNTPVYTNDLGGDQTRHTPSDKSLLTTNPDSVVPLER